MSTLPKAAIEAAKKAYMDAMAVNGSIPSSDMPKVFEAAILAALPYLSITSLISPSHATNLDVAAWMVDPDGKRILLPFNTLFVPGDKPTALHRSPSWVGQNPTAWRVRDMVGGWILCQTRRQAEDSEAGTGALIEPLYRGQSIEIGETK